MIRSIGPFVFTGTDTVDVGHEGKDVAAAPTPLAELDARALLPSIYAPTLVVGFEHGTGPVDPAISRFLANRIPNARLVLIGEEDDPSDIAWWHWYGRGDAILREIGHLIDDIRRHDRVFVRALATVLFTDIVDAASKVAELGDRTWRDLLAAHHGPLPGPNRTIRNQRRDVDDVVSPRAGRMGS